MLGRNQPRCLRVVGHPTYKQLPCGVDPHDTPPNPGGESAQGPAVRSLVPGGPCHGPRDARLRLPSSPPGLSPPDRDRMRRSGPQSAARCLAQARHHRVPRKSPSSTSPTHTHMMSCNVRRGRRTPLETQLPHSRTAAVTAARSPCRRCPCRRARRGGPCRPAMSGPLLFPLLSS